MVQTRSGKMLGESNVEKKGRATKGETKTIFTIPNAHAIEIIAEDLDDYEEGLVFLGCGKTMQDHVDGLNKLLLEEKIVTKPIFEQPVYLESGRIDLFFPFAKKGVDSEHIGRLAMFRLQFPDCKWISDYKDQL